ncbi:T9SS type A sorting domain-containing protein [Mangrovimonas xylaniphaga]|uniref:T9SS type A sorting domain-containing protein n=1 Tax=Mangrovimonas xylaniphaga TaxID=1645915 RepID=UPI0006B49724|nr:T9SS type A sorting domain-containing protein [Mangrovimonas xylaniphaga]
MKLKLPALLLGTFLGTSPAINAQNYEPLLINTGFTEDIIAEGSGSALYSTTESLDATDWSLMSNDFNPDGSTNLENALPTNGFFSSEATSGLNFQLGDYSGSNSLRLVTQETSGTLTFNNSVQASKLFIVGTSGSNSSEFSTTITFTDNSTQTFTPSLMPNWMGSTSQPRALIGFSRVNRNTDVIEVNTLNPRLYQIQLDILPANYGKTIQNIEIIKTSASGVLNIMAISTELSPSCLPIYNVEAETEATSAVISWGIPDLPPSNGYDYYLSTDSTSPNSTTEPTGNLDASTTSLSLSKLTTATSYYFWIRSNCGGYDLGDWSMISFTPGQINATYTERDIETQKGVPSSVTGENACPGTLTVSIPEGYQVANVSVSYNMSALGYGHKSDQRSILACNTTGNTEPNIYYGYGTTGTHIYNRNNIDIANGATGDVEFELRAWRSWGGTTGECSTAYNKVDNNTWTITVTYEAALSTPNYDLEQLSVFPNPATNVVTVKAGEQISDITIFNLLGQVVWNHKGNSLSEEINISTLAQGNYVLKTSTTTGKQATTKLIKQ